MVLVTAVTTDSVPPCAKCSAQSFTCSILFPAQSCLSLLGFLFLYSDDGSSARVKLETLVRKAQGIFFFAKCDQDQLSLYP